MYDAETNDNASSTMWQRRIYTGYKIPLLIAEMAFAMMFAIRHDIVTNMGDGYCVR